MSKVHPPSFTKKVIESLTTFLYIALSFSVSVKACLSEPPLLSSIPKASTSPRSGGENGSGRSPATKELRSHPATSFNILNQLIDTYLEMLYVCSWKIPNVVEEASDGLLLWLGSHSVHPVPDLILRRIGEDDVVECRRFHPSGHFAHVVVVIPAG